MCNVAGQEANSSLSTLEKEAHSYLESIIGHVGEQMIQGARLTWVLRDNLKGVGI